MKRQEFTACTKADGKRKVLLEEFQTLDEFHRVLLEREKTREPIICNERECCDKKWTGVPDFETAEELLTNGYEEPLEDIKTAYAMTVKSKTVNTITPSVVGGAPIVPNVIRGLPRSMMGVKKQASIQSSPIINLFVDITIPYKIKTWQVKGMAIKIVSDIATLEVSGYKVNLYVASAFCDWEKGNKCIASTIKVKDCNQRFNAQRLTFAMIHPAMLRCLMFQWYNYVPGSVLYYNYGFPLTSKYQNEDDYTKIGKEIFGHNLQNVAYVPIASLIDKDAMQREVHNTIQRAIAG